jgi:hypothetical protein
MQLRERALYHQIHPVKLATDWTAGAVAAYALWHRRLLLGLLVGLVPPIVVSLVFLTGALDLEAYKESPFGRYVARHMSGAMRAVRLVGVLPFWLGAWYHQWLAMAAGVSVIVAAWVRGRLWPPRDPGTPQLGNVGRGARGVAPLRLR